MVVDAPDFLGKIDAAKIHFAVEFHKIKCDRIKFTQEITRGHHHQEDADDIRQLDSNDGCRVLGKITVDKVGGNFKLGVTPENDKNNEPEAVKQMETRLHPGLALTKTFGTAPDLSHTIEHIYFEDMTHENNDIIVDKKNRDFHPEEFALRRETREVPLGMGIHQYSMQVVPTTFEPLRGHAIHSNRYSVTEREVEINQALMGATIGGQFFSDFVGIVFSYDFYPVKLVEKEENKGSFFGFLASLCGIVGGVVTVIGILERTLYQSAKALIGKKD